MDDLLEIPAFLRREDEPEREPTPQDLNSLRLLGWSDELIAKMDWSQVQYRVICRVKA